MSKRRRDANHDTHNVTMGRFSLVRFLVFYVALMAVVAFAMSFEPIKQILDINGLYTKAIVKGTAWLLKPFGLVRGVEGSIIHLSHISLDVKFGCNGLEAFLIYMVGVIAFPASWRQKLLGVVVGFFVIQLFNLLRIVALGYFGSHFSSYFYIFHIYVAQGIMIAISFVLFISWLSYVNKA